MAFVKKSNKVQASDYSVKSLISSKAKDSAKVQAPAEDSTANVVKKQNEITANVIKLTKEAVSKLTADMNGISDRVEKLEQNDLISKLGDYDKRLNVVEELVKKLSDRLTEVSDKLDSALDEDDSDEEEEEDDDEDSDEDSEEDSDEEEKDEDESDSEEDEDEDEEDSDEEDSADDDSDEDEESDSDEEEEDGEEIEIDPDAVLAVYNGMSKPEQLKLITKVKSDLGLKGRVLPKVEELVKDDDSLIAVATVMVDDFGIEAEQLAAEE